MHLLAYNRYVWYYDAVACIPLAETGFSWAYVSYDKYLFIIFYFETCTMLIHLPLAARC